MVKHWSCWANWKKFGGSYASAGEEINERRDALTVISRPIERSRVLSVSGYFFQFFSEVVPLLAHQL